jgi:hypothetical protein
MSLLPGGQQWHPECLCWGAWGWTYPFGSGVFPMTSSIVLHSVQCDRMEVSAGSSSVLFPLLLAYAHTGVCLPFKVKARNVNVT